MDGISDASGKRRPAQLFLLRVVLEVRERVSLHAHHAGVIYALLAAANGESGGPVAVADGLMPEVLEQCRILLPAGSRYAFGLTVLAPDGNEAAGMVRRTVDGLRRVGRSGSSATGKLAANFDVVGVEDCVAQVALDADDIPQAVPATHIDSEIEKLTRAQTVTLRFTSPLRLKRPSGQRRPGHAYFDDVCFSPTGFLLRLGRRLTDLGFLEESPPADLSLGEVVENGLVWLDLAYGPRSLRKTLGGALGRVTLRAPPPEACRLLVLGQYCRLGENTRFGFGCYRIEELGEAPFPCRRAVGLLSYCLSSPELDARAAERDLPSGTTSEAIRQILDGSYRPAPHTVLTIRQGSGGSRALAIPSALDRVLQRVVVDRLGPALEMFMAESSFAYRHGLGRDKAAARIRQAYARGFRYAIRTDFSRFFDSIDHRLLRRRLDAYLADEAMVTLMMTWVRAGSPEEGRGLPTGAPISPMLSNLFLDRFDEEVTAAGAILVRYADDFLILFPTEQDAVRRFLGAKEMASQLLLTLNSDKTAALDLSEPFDFLGYRFEHRERWEVREDGPPRRIEDLGWHDNHRAPEPTDGTVVLPGESSEMPATLDPVAVFGPGAAMIRTVADRIACSYVDGRDETSAPLDHLGGVIVLGRATLAGSAIHQLIERDIPVLLGDDSGSTVGAITGQSDLEDPEAVAAQVRASEDPASRLAIARTLIRAKLHNYAALCVALDGEGEGASAAQTLRQRAAGLDNAESVEALLGMEGAGAALWYRRFDAALPTGFHLARRTGPNASDPVNVMINIAQTVLYRQMILSTRRAGFVPSLGILHRARPGHAGLASDLQEPFRHLMDLAVILAAREITAQDFKKSTHGPFALRIHPTAARRLYATIWTVLARHCRSRDGGEVRSYLLWTTAAARHLRRHLCSPDQPFTVFEHP